MWLLLDYYIIVCSSIVSVLAIRIDSSFWDGTHLYACFILIGLTSTTIKHLFVVK